jgi:ABC-type Fe3+ transport system permease subunit
MLSNFGIGLLFGLGVSAWVYNKMQRQTGGNLKSAATVAAVAGLFGLVVVMMLLSLFVKK